MTPADACPHCQGPIYDTAVERCTNCGRQLPLDRTTATQPTTPPVRSQPKRLQRPILRSPALPSTPASDAAQPEVPVAAVVARPPRLPLADDALIANAQAASNELYLRILTHSALGLALWSLLIVPLGRLGGVPYTTLPAVLAICTCALGTSSQPSRGFTLAGVTAAAALVIAWLWF